MTKFSYMRIVWISICVVLLSAEPEISVSGPVGSTAVLPCELTSVDTDTLYILWKIKSEIVFERLSERSYQAEGYEGRVDVPVEELRKGNCSLVLHNLTPTDTGVYSSYKTVVRTKRGTVKISSVNLTVYGIIRDVPPDPQ
ncbi:antigen like protein, partial [Clarias magur]